MNTNHLGERTYSSFRGWKRAVLVRYPNAKFTGKASDTAIAYLGLDANRGHVGDWDDTTGVVFNTESQSTLVPAIEASLPS